MDRSRVAGVLGDGKAGGGAYRPTAAASAPS